MSQPKPNSSNHRASGGKDDCVRILHISDTHFSRKWDQDNVLAKLARDVRGLRERDGIAPDLVVWTGDVANRGAPVEYDYAEAWLKEQLLPAAGLDCERVVIVPGNHDVTRDSGRKATRLLRKDLLEKKDQDDIARVLTDERERMPFWDNLASYRNFVGRICSQEQPNEDLWHTRKIRVRQRDVRVTGLCSAWASYENEEENKLLIGSVQAIQVLPRERDADLSIAAMHHPWDFIAEFDRNDVREEVRRRSDLLLRGHLHSAAATLVMQPDTGLIEIEAGAAYAGSTYANSYNMIAWDFAARCVRVYPRYWDKHDWRLDANAFGGKIKSGCAELPMVRTGEPAAPQGRQRKVKAL